MTSRSRPGFTLIELCTVMGVLSIALSLSAIVLISVMGANQVGSATLLQLRLRADIADPFRADVASALEAPDQFGNLTAGPACLILRKPSGDHVIYEWQSPQLTRTVRSGERERRTIVSSGIPDTTIEFERGAGDRPLMILRLIESRGHGVIRKSEIVAALAGDAR